MKNKGATFPPKSSRIRSLEKFNGKKKRDGQNVAQGVCSLGRGNSTPVYKYRNGQETNKGDFLSVKWGRRTPRPGVW